MNRIIMQVKKNINFNKRFTLKITFITSWIKEGTNNYFNWGIFERESWNVNLERCWNNNKEIRKKTLKWKNPKLNSKSKVYSWHINFN